MNGLNRLLSSSLEYVEQKALEAHFSAVVEELDAQDTAELSPSRSRARARAVRELRAYAGRGLFPRNISRRERVPLLRDDRGVSCAVAHLLEAGGHKELVDSLARSDNHLYMESARDPRLLAWLEESGLTREEACRIQAVYVGQGMNGGIPVPVPQAPIALHPLATLPVAAPDHTALYLLAAVLAGTALWLGYRWLRRAPKLKSAAFAPRQPIIVLTDTPKRNQVLEGRGGP